VVTSVLHLHTLLLAKASAIYCTLVGVQADARIPPIIIDTGGAVVAVVDGKTTLVDVCREKRLINV